MQCQKTLIKPVKPHVILKSLMTYESSKDDDVACCLNL